MGCDIHGWVEVKPYKDEDDWWIPVIKIDYLVERDYELFGCFFGVRNYGNFKPIAPERGLPKNVSETVREDFKELGSGAHSPTYITYKEIKNIDWEEEAEDYSDRIFVYKEGNENNIENWESAFLMSSELTAEEYKKIEKGGEVRKNGKVYKRVKLKRKHVLIGNEGWQLLFKLMELLAKEYGEDNVRIVVWFDN